MLASVDDMGDVRLKLIDERAKVGGRIKQNLHHICIEYVLPTLAGLLFEEVADLKSSLSGAIHSQFGRKYGFRSSVLSTLLAPESGKGSFRKVID